MENEQKEMTERVEQLQSQRTETENVILKRRSNRLYKKKQVPEFMIKRILEAGRFAPSAGNCQPWKFVVLREPEFIEGITKTTVTVCKIFKWLIDYRYTGSLWRRLNANLNIRLKPNDRIQCRSVP
jgi:nitroreductase